MEGTCELHRKVKASSPQRSGRICGGLNTMATIVTFWWRNNTLTRLIGCDVTSMKSISLRFPQR